jgi:sec-independent protein translocase protein TatA
MGRIGIWEVVIIVTLVIVIFGARKLPDLGNGLGQGLANVRQAMRDFAMADLTKPRPPSPSPPAAESAPPPDPDHRA